VLPLHLSMTVDKGLSSEVSHALSISTVTFR